MPRKKTPAATAEPAARVEVADFMAALEHPRKPEIELLRSILRGADPRIREGIKWNAPSFYTTDHFATLKLRPGATVQVVFHTGAKAKARPAPLRIDDPENLLRWAAPDRAVATFADLADLADLRTRQGTLVAVTRQWLAQL